MEFYQPSAKLGRNRRLSQANERQVIGETVSLRIHRMFIIIISYNYTMLCMRYPHASRQ